MALRSSPGPKVNSGVNPRDEDGSVDPASGMETKSSSVGGMNAGEYWGESWVIYTGRLL